MQASSEVLRRIVDDLCADVERPFLTERGRPPPCDARPTQIDPKRIFSVLAWKVRKQMYKSRRR